MGGSHGDNRGGLVVTPGDTRWVSGCPQGETREGSLSLLCFPISDFSVSPSHFYNLFLEPSTILML